VTRRLEKFVRDYHKREQALDRQKAELREERDQAIRDAYQAGPLMVESARWSA
jgi:vacuolar-type H+-ATPase subunit H